MLSPVDYPGCSGPSMQQAPRVLRRPGTAATIRQHPHRGLADPDAVPDPSDMLTVWSRLAVVLLSSGTSMELLASGSYTA